MLWSYHSSDPINGNVLRHQHKGSKSINLLGGLENVRSVPSDSKSFFVRNHNVGVLDECVLAVSML